MKVITTNLLNRFWKNGVKPIKDSLSSKVNVTDIVNNLTTTVANKALDARQGKALDDKILELNRNSLRNTTTVYLEGAEQTGSVQNVIFNTPASRSPIMFYCTQGDVSFAFMVAINGSISVIKMLNRQVVAGTLPDVTVSAAGSAPGEMRLKIENKTSMGTLIHIVYGNIAAEWLRTSNA